MCTHSTCTIYKAINTTHTLNNNRTGQHTAHKSFSLKRQVVQSRDKMVSNMYECGVLWCVVHYKSLTAYKSSHLNRAWSHLPCLALPFLISSPSSKQTCRGNQQVSTNLVIIIKKEVKYTIPVLLLHARLLFLWSWGGEGWFFLFQKKYPNPVLNKEH